MSLNGLDGAQIKEAYDAAVAEPGGWWVPAEPLGASRKQMELANASMRRFLLKYISRDEVDILERGNGGIVEIRNAISKFEEPSPLFGFLRYRRRSVLIRYVPEDCSRLVQGKPRRPSQAAQFTDLRTQHDSPFISAQLSNTFLPTTLFSP